MSLVVRLHRLCVVGVPTCAVLPKLPFWHFSLRWLSRIACPSTLSRPSVVLLVICLGSLKGTSSGISPGRPSLGPQMSVLTSCTLAWQVGLLPYCQGLTVFAPWVIVHAGALVSCRSLERQVGLMPALVQ